MAVFPFVCENCKTFVIRDTPLLGQGSATVSFGTMKIGNACPQCKGDIYGIPGTYEVIDGISQFVKGPKASLNQFRKFLDLLDDAIAESLTAEEFRKRAQESAPDVYDAMGLDRDFDAGGTFRTFLLILGIVIQIYYFEAQLDQDQEQHEEQMEQAEEHHEEVMERAVEQANRLSPEEVRQMLQEMIADLESGEDEDGDGEDIDQESAGDED